jgi:hypothetical protein
MSKVLDIEQSFQNWLSTVRENYSYVLCAPECAARYSFEAGVNAARNEAKESTPTASNNARDEICAWFIANERCVWDSICECGEVACKAVPRKLSPVA